MRISDWSSDVCSSDLDPVHAGTLNVEAPIRVRVTAAGADTAIADIARLMGEAAQGKSRYVRIADRAARLYAPAVHGLALAAFAGWMVAGAGWHQSMLIAVAVLIVTCPCAPETGRASGWGRWCQDVLIMGVAVDLKKKRT